MTAQTFTASPATTNRTKPTAADLEKAQAVLTGPTLFVCGGITVLLTIVLNVVGLAIGLFITVLVLASNANVRRMSIQNAIADRLEGEGQR